MFVPRVKEIAKEKGVDVVYGSVGQSNFTKLFDFLCSMGMIAGIGQASRIHQAFEDPKTTGSALTSFNPEKKE